MSVLSTVRRGVSQAPPRIMIYGVEGIGKSTFGADAPKPIFLQTEDGCEQIGVDRFPLCANYSELLQQLSAIATEDHDYQTVVLDSADWLERLIWAHTCQQEGVDTIEKVGGGYGKGYTKALSQWSDVVAAFDYLRSRRQMAVVLIAHSKVERFEDPESAPYDRYSPRMHKTANALLVEWCDAVLFATRKTRVATEDKGFGRTRGVATPVGKAGGDRVIRCVGSPACVAKNRYGISEELPLSWAAWAAAMAQHSKKGD